MAVVTAMSVLRVPTGTVEPVGTYESNLPSNTLTASWNASLTSVGASVKAWAICSACSSVRSALAMSSTSCAISSVSNTAKFSGVTSAR